MDFLNLTSLLYVGFRLSPFILVSYFVISSIFNSDIRGIIFLGLLLVEIFIATIIGNTILTTTDSNTNYNAYGVCNAMNLTPTGPLSRYIPLNLNIFSYTLGYLAGIFYEYREQGLIISNIPVVIFIGFIVVYHVYWLYVNLCAGPWNIFWSLSLGFGFGWLFSYIIISSKLTDMQYFAGLTKQDICKRPAKQLFRCTTKNVM